MKLIDADALHDALRAKQKWIVKRENMVNEGYTYDQVHFAIDDMPTVDAVPVRHGKWELAKDGWYCSACELYPPFDCDPEEKGIPYCPNCGARMDERKEE